MCFKLQYIISIKNKYLSILRIIEIYTIIIYLLLFFFF